MSQCESKSVCVLFANSSETNDVMYNDNVEPDDFVNAIKCGSFINSDVYVSIHDDIREIEFAS